ncbi:hypothetical protein C8Q80DRAFT_130695 [Daedaleopsis nitida]|nr:hypothetical protein C8Q80DRAFT_130695 [Daedaleopsis nitida]
MTAALVPLPLPLLLPLLPVDDHAFQSRCPTHLRTHARARSSPQSHASQAPVSRVLCRRASASSEVPCSAYESEGSQAPAFLSFPSDPQTLELRSRKVPVAMRCPDFAFVQLASVARTVSAPSALPSPDAYPSSPLPGPHAGSKDDASPTIHDSPFLLFHWPPRAHACRHVDIPSLRSQDLKPHHRSSRLRWFPNPTGPSSAGRPRPSFLPSPFRLPTQGLSERLGR